jgi:hypothetical protein
MLEKLAASSFFLVDYL